MYHDTPYIYALTQVPKLGKSSIKQLITFFEHAKNIWNASKSELLESGLSPSLIEQIRIFKKQTNVTDIASKLSEYKNLKIIPISHSDYPRMLKEIHDPPSLLYIDGNLQCLHMTCVAIVGSRKMSDYGKSVILDIIQTLQPYDIVITSGLALGVDGQAHQCALDHDIKTCAVIGSGHNEISPMSNLPIASDIIRNNGCIVSEYEPDIPASKYTFPQRNRIISGLSKVTIVVEAAKKSGALITAYQAIDQNREVMAVPGNIFSPTSQGCNILLTKGAHPYANSSSLLEILDLPEITHPEGKVEYTPKNEYEQKILDILEYTPQHINDLVKKADLPEKIIYSTLSILVLEDAIREDGAKNYSKR